MIWYKSVCDVKQGTDPCPLLARSRNRWWLDSVTFTAHKKSRFSLKRRSAFRTGAKVYLSEKKYILGLGALQLTLIALILYYPNRESNLSLVDWNEISEKCFLIHWRCLGFRSYDLWCRQQFLFGPLLSTFPTPPPQDFISVYTLPVPCTSLELLVISILGDPGAVSGGGKKSKRARKKFGRRKVKNDFSAPEVSTFSRPH